MALVHQPAGEGKAIDAGRTFAGLHLFAFSILMLSRFTELMAQSA